MRLAHMRLLLRMEDENVIRQIWCVVIEYCGIPALQPSATIHSQPEDMMSARVSITQCSSVMVVWVKKLFDHSVRSIGDGAM